eukprot:6267469-Amphidinium_carterae.1
MATLLSQLYANTCELTNIGAGHSAENGGEKMTVLSFFFDLVVMYTYIKPLQSKINHGDEVRVWEWGGLAVEPVQRRRGDDRMEP